MIGGCGIDLCRTAERLGTALPPEISRGEFAIVAGGRVNFRSSGH